MLLISVHASETNNLTSCSPLALLVLFVDQPPAEAKPATLAKPAAVAKLTVIAKPNAVAVSVTCRSILICSQPAVEANLRLKPTCDPKIHSSQSQYMLDPGAR